MDTITTVLQYKDCCIKCILDVITITHTNGYSGEFQIERKHKFAYVRKDEYLLPIKSDKFENAYNIATQVVDFIKATTKNLD